MPCKSRNSLWAIALLVAVASAGCRSTNSSPPALSSAGSLQQEPAYAAPTSLPPPSSYAATPYPQPTASNAPYGAPSQAAPPSGPPAYGNSSQASAPVSSTRNSFGPSYSTANYPSTMPPATALTVPPPAASSVSYGITGPATPSSGQPVYGYGSQANRPESDTSSTYGPSYSATRFSSPTYSTPTSSAYSSSYDSYDAGSSSGCKSGCCSH